MRLKIIRNPLHYYADLLRLEENEQREQGDVYVRALHNTIRTMKQARHGRLCGEDFSRLDFGNIPLNNIHFSLEGQYPSSFDGAKLNEWNFRNGHSGSVTAVAWSPDGKYILSGSSDCTAILWEAGSGLMVRKYTGHTDSITSLAFSPDGIYAVTGSTDCTAIVWNIETGSFKRLEEHTVEIISVAALSDGSCLTLDRRNTLKKWDMQSGECLDNSSPENATLMHGKLSPCCKYCLSRFTDPVQIFDTSSWKLKKTFKEHKGNVRKAAFSADGKYLLTSSSKPAVKAEDVDILEVKIWDLKTEKCLKTLLTDFHGEVAALAVSSDGKLYFTETIENFGENEDMVGNIWNLKGECLATLTDHNDELSDANFSADGKTLCTGTGNGGIILWDTESGKRILTIEGSYGSIYTPEISDDGKYCFTGLNFGNVRVWDIENARYIKEIDGYGERVVSLPHFPNGRYYVTQSDNGNYNIRSLKTGECVRALDEYGSLEAFLPDERYLSLGIDLNLNLDFNLVVTDISSGVCKKVGKWETRFFGRKAAFHPSGRYCIFDNNFTGLFIWDFKMGKSVKKFYDFDGIIESISFSSDGNYFMILLKRATWYDTAVLVWDFWDFEKEQCLAKYKFHSLKYARLVGKYIYGITEKESVFTVFRQDYTSPDNNSTPETLAVFYNLKGIHIKGCSFRGITADETARTIIYQYGGDIDRPQ